MSSDESRESAEADPLLREHRAALCELRENVERLKKLIEDSEELSALAALQSGLVEAR